MGCYPCCSWGSSQHWRPGVSPGAPRSWPLLDMLPDRVLPSAPPPRGAGRPQSLRVCDCVCTVEKEPQTTLQAAFAFFLERLSSRGCCCHAGCRLGSCSRAARLCFGKSVMENHGSPLPAPVGARLGSQPGQEQGGWLAGGRGAQWLAGNRAYW